MFLITAIMAKTVHNRPLPLIPGLGRGQKSFPPRQVDWLPNVSVPQHCYPDGFALDRPLIR